MTRSGCIHLDAICVLIPLAISSKLSLNRDLSFASRVNILPSKPSICHFLSSAKDILDCERHCMLSWSRACFALQCTHHELDSQKALMYSSSLGIGL